MLTGIALLVPGVASAQTVRRLDAAVDAVAMPMATGGRMVRGTAGAHRRQWPASYFEAAFRGSSVLFTVGAGEVSLRISVDGGAAVPLVRPAPGAYRVEGLKAGAHRIRIDVASESQNGPTEFGGFHATPGTTALPPADRRRRQIEFIGDSHTVGYANASTKQECTGEEMWQTTDASRGVGPLVAARHGAGYQVNAISGRGVVRNYGGGSGDTVPAAYRYTVFDGTVRYEDDAWQPQVIAISLGTNDFSTVPGPGERWKTAEALRADYQAGFVEFVRDLRRRNPQAFFILWSTDIMDGMVAREIKAVADRLVATGERRLAHVPVTGLTFGGCHHHPDLADDRHIAAALSRFIDGRPDVWRTKQSDARR